MRSQKFNLKYGFSRRHGGVSRGPFDSLNLGLDVGDEMENVAENYRIFCDEVGVPMEKICVAIQDHGDQVEIVTEGRGIFEPFSGIDGFITDVPDVPLVVRFADCQGVLIHDSLRGVIAAVHCGWRGNTLDILGKTVARLVEEFACEAGDLHVHVSPSLGPCCAEFSDPLSELPEFMHEFVNGRKVDLWECSLRQLERAGVLVENIEMARRCTVCKNEEFFSYRGGKGQTGHMAGVIMLMEW